MSVRLPLLVGGEGVVPAQFVPWAIDGVGKKEPALVPSLGGGAHGERHALRGGQGPGGGRRNQPLFHQCVPSAPSGRGVSVGLANSCFTHSLIHSTQSSSEAEP